MGLQSIGAPFGIGFIASVIYAVKIRGEVMRAGGVAPGFEQAPALEGVLV